MARTSKNTKNNKKEAKQSAAPLRTEVENAAVERMATLFKALADPTRLHIIGLLRRQATLARTQPPIMEVPAETVEVVDKVVDVRKGKRIAAKAVEESAEDDAKTDALPGEVTVGDICLYITGDQEFTSTVFHHIKELKIAGLISIRRDGKRKRCRLNPERLLEMAAYFGPVPDEAAPVTPKPAAKATKRRVAPITPQEQNTETLLVS